MPSVALVVYHSLLVELKVSVLVHHAGFSLIFHNHELLFQSLLSEVLLQIDKIKHYEKK